jgi:hypothetical protein
MGPVPIWRLPHLIRKYASLALGVLVDARPVEARVEPAWRLEVGELAAGDGAVCAVSAKRHIRVAEVTAGVRAVGEEFARFFGLMGDLLRGGGVSSHALSVLASSSKWAIICQVDGRTFGCRGRLVAVRAILVCASQIVATDALCSLISRFSSLLGRMSR